MSSNKFNSNPNQSSEHHEHESAHNPQSSKNNVYDPFNINSTTQFYLNQLNHVSKLSQSILNQSNQNIDPIETNMKIWNESIDYFSQFMMPNIMQSHPYNDGANTNKDNNEDGSTKDINEGGSTYFNTAPINNKSLEKTLEELNKLTQRFVDESIKRIPQKNNTGQSIMFDVMDGWQQFASAMFDNSPVSLIEQQTNLWQKQFQLYQSTLQKMAGNVAEPVITPEKGDKRFKDEDWTTNPVFDYLKQSYLLTVDSMMDTIDNAEGLDDKTRQRLSFFTRQWLNAIAPSNFLWGNPEVLKLTQESGGQNLITGLKQLAEDMGKSAQILNISMTDQTAFELGKNIATTEGKVVFRNRMFELIQYAPTTDKVYKKPLLIVPPWINKFYILDLKEKNSYIRWALNEGHSVFVISWVNPNQSYQDVGMDTYMHEGLLTALDVVKNITGEPNANVIGYCIGGMLLSLTLAWLAEKNESDRIASATFWTTMFDFSDPGDLGVFIDERIIGAIEDEAKGKGVFDGRLMGVAFSLLRENSLYWNYYVQNYLKGERPTPFDLLYWNSDCTNVTAGLHSFVLRELYSANKLIKKNELEFDGVKVDLSKVKTPVYVVAALQDHIVKWKGSYASTQVLGGDVTFVLGESGHVAGIINPPTGKYGYYINDNYEEDPDTWFENAERQDRSWWLHWGEWIKNHTGGDVKSRQPGVNSKGQNVTILADAPGTYVHVKAEEALNSTG